MGVINRFNTAGLIGIVVASCLSGCAISDKEACIQVVPQLDNFVSLENQFSTTIERAIESDDWHEVEVAWAVNADKYRVISSKISKINGSQQFEKASLQFTTGLNEVIHAYDTEMKVHKSTEQITDDIEAGLIMLRDLCPA